MAIINLTSPGIGETITSTQTLDNGTLNIGNDSSPTTPSVLEIRGSSGSVLTLTLGSNFQVLQVGAFAAIEDEIIIGDEIVPGTNHTIINKGSITAGVSGGQFFIGAINVTNEGVVTVSNGDSLTFGAAFNNYGSFDNAAGGTITVSGAGTSAVLTNGSWSNQGTISFGTGTTGYIQQDSDGSWTNTGTISLAAGATLHLGGQFTTAQLTGISNSGGSIFIDGPMTNAGTLTVGAGSSNPLIALESGNIAFPPGAPVPVDGGSIVGGTVVDVGPGLTFDGGILSGVKFDGTVDLSPADSLVYLTNGFTGAGANGTGKGTINLTGSGSGIIGISGETLDNATVDIGNATTASYINVVDGDDTHPALTFGTNFSIVQVGTLAAMSSGYSTSATHETIDNKGSISANVAGGSFTIDVKNFINEGTITVGNGDTLTIEGPSLYNSNETFDNAAGATFSVTGSGTVATFSHENSWSNEGTISIGAGAIANIGGANTGTIELGAGATLSFFVTAGSGTYVVGTGATLDLDVGTTSGQTINFAGPNATVDISASPSVPVTVSGLAKGDTLDLGGVFATSADIEGGNLVVRNGSTVVDTIAVSAAAADLTFTAHSDGHNGTNIVVGLAHTVADDFSANGTSDTFYRNASTGQDEVLQSNGNGTFATIAQPTVGNNWTVAGTGDFNGDGAADLLWRDSSGDDVIWTSNGNGTFAEAFTGPVPTTWTLAAIGDFTGNGKSDILWRNGSGQDVIWTSNGDGTFAAAFVPTVPTNWSIAGVGDFNGDGKTDILWRDTAGDDVIWTANSDGTFAEAFTGPVPTNWTVAGIGDFNGDGKSDIFWRDPTTGQDVIWTSNGDGTFNPAFTNTVATNWSIVQVGDFNGDGKSDILWRDTAGDSVIWQSNGDGTFAIFSTNGPSSAFSTVPSNGSTTGTNASLAAPSAELSAQLSLAAPTTALAANVGAFGSQFGHFVKPHTQTHFAAIA